MRTVTINNEQVFELQECITCGCTFLIPQIMGNQLRKNENDFFCPSGHSMSYTKSLSDTLKQKLEDREIELEMANSRIRELENQPKRKAMRKAV